MNQLKVNEQQAIVALAARGWSRRRIARELGIDRGTVRKYLEAAKPAIPTAGSDAGADSKPAISTAGSAGLAEPKPAILTAGSPAGRRSQCEPYRSPIETGWQTGLSAQRIYQDLAAEHGFTGSYESVKRFVRQLNANCDPPFRRMECLPGEEMQVDFGQGAWILEDGKRRRPHLFRAVLSHSRKGYSEAVWRQNTETFIRCLENAFRHFGGVTQTTVIDNLKAGVLAADWYDPELNPKLRSFAEHYGTTILPTQPATPRHKGKVEAGVKYVQANALQGRSFASLAEQNLFLTQWERAVADTRIHGTVRQQVGKLFEAIERPALRPLPASIFPCFEEVQRSVHRDGYVEFQKAYYSAPPEYVGRQLWVRAEARLVRLFNARMELVGAHARSEAGRFVTAQEHLHPHKRHPIERGAEYLLGRCRLLGPNTGAWAEAMLRNRGLHHLRVLQGLLHLAGQQPGAGIERAAGIALHRGAFRLRDLKRLIGENDTVVQVDFLQVHPLIRDLQAYRLDAFSSP
jgi:transposase